MRQLGSKVVVVGVSASGKSEFARKLAKKTGLTLFHTDEIMWKPGWNYVGDEETVQQLREISARDAWLIEGFIEKGAFEYVLRSADTILYLDYPPLISAWRYVKRWLQHRKTPRAELPGCPEKFDFEFLRNIWLQKEVYRVNKFLRDMPDPEKVLRFKLPREARKFLERF